MQNECSEIVYKRAAIAAFSLTDEKGAVGLHVRGQRNSDIVITTLLNSVNELQGTNERFNDLYFKQSL